MKIKYYNRLDKMQVYYTLREKNIMPPLSLRDISPLVKRWREDSENSVFPLSPSYHGERCPQGG